MKRAVFFDMDHTVLRVDSSLSWMHFLRRRGELRRRLVPKVIWWALQYKLALLDIDVVADRVVADIRGESEQETLEKIEIWHRRHIAPAVSSDAIDAVRRHKQDEGDVLVLLTGGTQFAATKVAAMLGIDHVLSTVLEVEHGRFTGRLAQRCFGVHKVTIAEAWAHAHEIDLADAVFYSDSYNDLPMLSRVGRPIVVNPDVRLRRHARRVGWPIERWS